VIEESKFVKCNRSTKYNLIEISLDKCRNCSNYQGEFSKVFQEKSIPKVFVSCILPYTLIYSTSRIYTIKRYPRVKSRFICSICGRKFEFPVSQETLRRHERGCKRLEETKQADEKKQKQRDYDLKLLASREVPSYRKYFAIYRLYRYHNMSPKQIAHISSYEEHKIRDIIGLIFAELCKKDRKCVFRKYFEN